MVGGRPVRSSDTRRSSVSREVSCEGISFSASSCASTNRSTGVRTHASLDTAGSGAFFGGDIRPVLFDGLRCGRPGGHGPFRTLIDPGADEGRLLGGERFFVQRHPVFVAFAEDALDDVALRAVAGHEQGAGGAALQRQVADVQAEFAAALLLAVALEALLAKDGLDLRGEVDPRAGCADATDVVGQPRRPPRAERRGKNES